jgi:hypothetical protein
MITKSQSAKNNAFRWFIRAWIGLTTLAAFIFGWIFLGHSGKPVSAGVQTSLPGEVAPLPTLAPLPSLNDGSFAQPSAQQPSIQFARPMFRTRGSYAAKGKKLTTKTRRPQRI